MIIAYVPLFTSLLGILIYILATNPKASEIGRIMFLCAFLFVMWSLAGKLVHLL